MKKTLAIAFASALFYNAQAQQAVGTPDNLQRFKNTTTMVVLDNNPLLEYNFKIKETVEKHWNINKYDVVTFSSSDFENARKDSTKAFLMRNTETLLFINNGKSEILEPNILLNYLVCANQEINTSLLKFLYDLSLLFRTSIATQKFHINRKMLKSSECCLIMLIR